MVEDPRPNLVILTKHLSIRQSSFFVKISNRFVGFCHNRVWISEPFLVHVDSKDMFSVNLVKVGLDARATTYTPSGYF